MAVASTAPSAAEPAPEFGLSEAEAARRLAAAPPTRARPSRTVREILRANLFTRFNALLGSLLIVVLVIGPLQDAVFGLILVANTSIAIVQELRAKLALDRLALLNAPSAEVIRDGRSRRIPAAEVVEGDAIRIGEGEEVAADAHVQRSAGLEVNESLLTGEAAPVPKRAGDGVLAGSFVVGGSAICEVESAGTSTYAAQIAGEARRFQLVRSDLMAGINRILQVITWVIPPMALMLLVTQLRAAESVADALRGAVAGVITLVPEGLVLLTSVSLAVAIVRLGRRRVLVQQLSAVEMLARVDLVCFDKTGTLTDGSQRLGALEILDDSDRGPAEAALAELAALDAGGELAQLVPDLPPRPGWRVTTQTPFSSDRGWSSATFAGEGTWVLGAPDRLLAAAEPGRKRAEELARQGRRVLLLASAAEPAQPARVSPRALVVLEERLRPNVSGVVESLLGEGVQVAILSGDHPATVAGVATAAGLPVGAGVDVCGRVTPEGKADFVRSRQAAGRTVAMLGDGVNDVLALKAADIGLAIGGGSTAARAVATVVLLDGDFAAIPAIVAEGRRVIGNVELLASLFLTKTVYAALLGIGVAVWQLPFPFLPRHLTLISAFTIGIPSFFLALAPNTQRVRPGFLSRVAAFALPTGVVAAFFTFCGYYLALGDPQVRLGEARTAAALVLAGLGIWVLSILARPLTPARRWLVVAMVAGLIGAVLLPPLKLVFGIDLPHAMVLFAAVGLIALGGATLEGGRWASAQIVLARRMASRLRPPNRR